ncbi:MAG TPA: FAD-dependent oxidoreductase, partial [Solirubrobacteraceae bacterium]
GARIATRVEVTALDAGGVQARDVLTGAALGIRARRVVLATGVWAGTLSPGVELRPSRGSHLVVPAERLADPRAAVSVPVPTPEGSRWVFSLPRPDGLVTIGLTDVPHAGPIPDEPQVSAAEEAELLAHASRALDVQLTSADVVGRHAGLRPLLAAEGEHATADLSRRHAVVEDPETGALTVVGGKLTTYRRMAQDVVDRISDRPCRTASLPLVGAQAGADAGAAWLAVPAVARARLVRRYGAEAPDVTALADGRPELLEPLAPGIGVCAAELRFAVAHELALSLEDLLDRRTRLGLVPERRAAAEAAVRDRLPELAGVLA